MLKMYKVIALLNITSNHRNPNFTFKLLTFENNITFTPVT